MDNIHSLTKSLEFVMKLTLTAPSKRLVLPLFMSNSKKKVFFKKENTKDLSLYIFKQSKKNFSNIYFKKNYDLRFNWLKCREAQQQFDLIWKK